jgi:hypothetical protein
VVDERDGARAGVQRHEGGQGGRHLVPPAGLLGAHRPRPAVAVRREGQRRLYSYRDLLELRVIKSLLDAGIKLESVRQAFRYLRDHVDTDIASAHLVINGNDVVLCDGDQLVDVMRRAGQGVLNVLPLGGVKEHLDSEIHATGDAAPPADGGRGSAQRLAL